MSTISTEERRKVARRLRMSRSEWSGMCWKLWLGPKFGAVVLSDGNRDELEDAAHRLADLIEPSCDRDELLEEVKELEKCAYYFGLNFDDDEPLRDRLKEASEEFAESARRIREALGVSGDE